MRAASLAVMKVSKASRRLFRSRKAFDAETEDTPSVQVTDNATSVATVHKDTDKSKYMPLLFSLCKRWAWPAVTFRCQTHPHEAHVTIQDDKGDTALHWACFGNPPLDAIEALLTACPELAAATNKQGVLPIHGEYQLPSYGKYHSFYTTLNIVLDIVAASYRAAGEVIRALLKAYPEAAGVASNSGSYPMHILCDYGASVDAIHAMLETRAGVESLIRLDGTFHRSPLYILNARKGMNEFHNAIFSLRRERAKGRRDSLLMRDLVVHCESLDFWKKTSLLIQTEYTGNVLLDVDDDVDNAYIVHACAGIDGCPPALLEYAMLLHPEQLMIPDENCQLPLHIAASRSDTIILTDILGACPGASKMRNRRGQLPIELAVESGRQWTDGVGQLLEANPGSLEVLNIDERVYPLIWSRLSGGSNAIFESMRARPSVCRGL